MKQLLGIPLLLIFLLLAACAGPETEPVEMATAEADASPNAQALSPVSDGDSSGQAAATPTIGQPVIASPTMIPTPEGGYPPPAPPDAYPSAAILPATSGYPDPNESGTGDADVTFVRAVLEEDGTWTFEVSIDHEDTGADDYANGWDVVTPNGAVIDPEIDTPFTHLLLHPHVGERPFTRSQSGIVIPTDVTQVIVRAHEIPNGYGGQEVVVDLTTTEGENYVVER